MGRKKLYDEAMGVTTSWRPTAANQLFLGALKVSLDVKSTARLLNYLVEFVASSSESVAGFNSWVAGKTKRAGTPVVPGPEVG